MTKPKQMFWEFLHNALAHPLMAITFNSRLSDRFHDWTADKAWPQKGGH